jgi:hypothetical protein
MEHGVRGRMGNKVSFKFSYITDDRSRHKSLEPDPFVWSLGFDTPIERGCFICWCFYDHSGTHASNNDLIGFQCDSRIQKRDVI